MKSYKILLQVTIFLALAFILLPCAGQAKDATTPASKAAATSSKNDFYVLNFPPGPALAEILWNTAAEDKIKGKGRVLATGKVKVPKNQPLEIVLTVDSLDHMEAMEKLAGLPVRNLIASKLDFTDEHLQHFKDFKSLSYINLDQTLVTDKSLPIIAGLPFLVSLRLSGTDVIGSNFEALSKLQLLDRLNIHGISLKPGYLKKLKATFVYLKELDISATNLTHDDASALAYCTVLKGLDVRGNKGFDDSCITFLSKLKMLKSIDVTDTRVTEKSLAVLSQLPKLRSLVVRARSFWVSGEPKETNGRLTVVDSASKSNATIDIFRPLH